MSALPSLPYETMKYYTFHDGWETVIVCEDEGVEFKVSSAVQADRLGGETVIKFKNMEGVEVLTVRSTVELVFAERRATFSFHDGERSGVIDEGQLVQCDKQSAPEWWRIKRAREQAEFSAWFFNPNRLVVPDRLLP